MTLASYKVEFYKQHGRQPTEEEIFTAGCTEGARRQMVTSVPLYEPPSPIVYQVRQGASGWFDTTQEFYQQSKADAANKRVLSVTDHHVATIIEALHAFATKYKCPNGVSILRWLGFKLQNPVSSELRGNIALCIQARNRSFDIVTVRSIVDEAVDRAVAEDKES